MLNQLHPPQGATKKRKRIGRGPGSGHGKTSTRGHKGHGARTGGGPHPRFEGGQMPLIRRLPKRGFTNIFRETTHIVNLRDLERFEQGSVVDPEVLRKAGLVKGKEGKIKILGKGKLTKPLTVKAHKFSGTAQSSIAGIGGKVEVID